MAAAMAPFVDSFNRFAAAARHSSLLRPSSFSSSPCSFPFRFSRVARLSAACTGLPNGGVAVDFVVPPVERQLRSPDLVAIEYAELNLPHRTAEDLGHVRIRQHVNPLSSSFSVPAEVPQWSSVFKDPTLPLMVDIGCGSGRFLLWLAKMKYDLGNYLGLEIRQKLVKRANCWAKELELDNIHFLFANASVSFNNLVSSYPGPLAMVSILCPDPHFKKKHHKRRVVQKQLVDSIVKNLESGGKVLLQSDVLEVAVDMRNRFDEKLDVLKKIESVCPDVSCNEDGWLMENPMGIRTEREIHAEFEGANIYRTMYVKKERNLHCV